MTCSSRPPLSALFTFCSGPGAQHRTSDPVGPPYWLGCDPALASGLAGPTRLCALPQVIQQPPKPGALIRPPQVTLTQTPMVALRQPHSRIVLTAPQQIQLNQLQPGEGCTPVGPRAALRTVLSPIFFLCGEMHITKLTILTTLSVGSAALIAFTVLWGLGPISMISGCLSV